MNFDQWVACNPQAKIYRYVCQHCYVTICKGNKEKKVYTWRPPSCFLAWRWLFSLRWTEVAKGHYWQRVSADWLCNPSGFCQKLRKQGSAELSADLSCVTEPRLKSWLSPNLAARQNHLLVWFRRLCPPCHLTTSDTPLEFQITQSIFAFIEGSHSRHMLKRGRADGGGKHSGKRKSLC